MPKVSIEREIYLVAKENPTRKKKGHDVYFIWLTLMFIAVVAGHFVLNVSGGIPTGYVAATENPVENLTLLVNSLVAVVTICIAVGIAAMSVTKNDYEFFR